ncbi:phage/plasmid primase, P4 family [Methanocella arvoryzae]|nr:phage/plasmid primase, P4 family [Methanocella arvoryzae]
MVNDSIPNPNSPSVGTRQIAEATVQMKNGAEQLGIDGCVSTDLPTMADKLDSIREQNLNGALLWVHRGASVIPLIPGKKIPYCTWDWSVSEGSGVFYLWEKFPYALIGVMTGKSGYIVWDFDKKHGGLETYNLMCQLYPELKESYIEETRSGGLHVYFTCGDLTVKKGVDIFMKKLADGKKVPKWADKNWPGVDICANGSIAVAAPSVDVKGEYKVLNNKPIQPISQGLIDLLRLTGRVMDAEAFEKAEADPAYSKVEAQPIPNRYYKEQFAPICIKGIVDSLKEGKADNDSMFALACYLMGLNLENEAILSVYSVSPKFDRGLTEHYLNYYRRMGYKCQTCVTMQANGLCTGGAGCNKVKSPAWNYRNTYYVENWPYDNAKDEKGVADMLADLYGDDIRYVRGTEKWYTWNGENWPEDVDEAHLSRMITCMADLVMDRLLFLSSLTKTITEGEARKAHKAHIENLYRQFHKMRTVGNIKSMIKMASMTIESIILDSVDELDKDKHLINLLNGAFNLDTSEFIPHGERTKPYLMTLRANVAYNPEAKRPRFDKFIDEITCGDKDLADYLQRSLGYALSGYTGEEKFFAWFGNGRNGKSKLAEAILYLMGDYASSANATAFIMPKNGNIRSFSFARLRGKRFIRCSEVPENSVWNDVRIKEFLSDTITAEEKFGAEFDYKPQGKLFFLCNHLPAMPKDRSTETKFFVVPFDLQLEPHQVDMGIEEALKAEAEGILLWMIEGYQKWKANDLRRISQAVKEASDRYWRDADWFAAFLSDMCVIDPSAEVDAGELYTTFKSWQERVGAPIQSATAFGKRLTSSGFKSRESKRTDRDGRKRTVNLRIGLKLKIAIATCEDLIAASIDDG